MPKKFAINSGCRIHLKPESKKGTRMARLCIVSLLHLFRQLRVVFFFVYLHTTTCTMWDLLLLKDRDQIYRVLFSFVCFSNSSLFQFKHEDLIRNQYQG